jgi:DNA-binding MarR family transcriptional regulator
LLIVGRYDSLLSMRTVSNRQHAVKSRSAQAEAFSGLAIQVITLAAALQEAGNALAAPAGQTAARWQVMAAVESGPASVADVARALSLARQSVQRVADALMADGVARYADNPAHRRAKLLALTPAGRRALRTIQAAQVEWAEQVAGPLDAHELARARETLAAVRDRLR